MKQQKHTKGISLIVLVITIIVMIILAGVIIISLSNGNVIAQAKIAKESSDFVNIRQMVEMERGNMLLNNSATISGVTVPSSYANDIEVTIEGTILLKYNATTKISDIPNAVEKLGAVYIPNGFIVSTVAGEMAKETGLVIKDNITGAGTIGNEYVWVPVEGTLKTEEFFSEQWWSQHYGDGVGPSNLFTEYTGSVGYVPMKTSVEKYNGFYVSRYEAGTSTISTGSNLAMDGTLKPLSQKNKYVWNKIPWDLNGSDNIIDTNNGAPLVAKKAYDGNTAVASCLLYGAQYDAMLNYINSTSTGVINSTTWGNHYNSTFTVSAGAKRSTDHGVSYIDISTPTTKPANASWLLTTGASERSKVKNIYDVAGNVSEWTYETLIDFPNIVMRSGNYSMSAEDHSAAYRYEEISGAKDSIHGFRFALYIL